jgi:hypothetical protein
VIVAHVIGLPVEESLVLLAPAGSAAVTAVAIAARTTLARLRRRCPGRAERGDAPASAF